MTLVTWRRTLILCLVGLFLIIICSMVIEGLALQREIGEVRSCVRLAAKGSLNRFANLEFASGEFKDHAYTSDAFNIKNDDQFAKLNQYMNNIVRQASDKGVYTNTSDIKYIVSALQESWRDYRNGVYDSVYTPMQFGYSFLDQELLDQMFNEDIERMILSNYHQDKEKGLNLYNLAFNGMDRVKFKDAKVALSAPMFISQEDDFSGRSFASLFGSTREHAIDMAYGTHEFGMKEYDYVIAYDVVFTLEWEHQTITPFFKNWNMIASKIDSKYMNDLGQLVIPMEPMVYSKRYILTN